MAEAFATLSQAKTSLSELIERAAAGEEIVIAKAGKPKARLVPLAGGAEPRQPGGWEGKVWVAEDFDERLPADILAVSRAATEQLADQLLLDTHADRDGPDRRC